MRKSLLTTLMVVVSTGALAQSLAMTDLLDRLDQAIAHSADYVAQRQSTIDSLRSQYAAASQPEQRYQQALALFQSYHDFESDSAVHYIDAAISQAALMGREDLRGQAMSLLANHCAAIGHLGEAQHTLQQIRRAQLSPSGLADYYIACRHTFDENRRQSSTPGNASYYKHLNDVYYDSLMAVADTIAPYYFRARSSELIYGKRFAEAQQVIDRWYASQQANKRNLALVCYYRHLMYLVQEDAEQAKYWLAQSAIYDVENAVMDQGSLWNLAKILGDEGDIDRAYRYINFSWNATMRFGVGLRSQQMSPVLAVIEQQYKNEVERNSRKTAIFATVVGVMAVILLLLLLFVLRQKNRLHETNIRLHETNIQLNESNRVKEEYVGRFMHLCSLYVERMDDNRRQVVKKLKDRQYQELMDAMRSPEVKEKDIDEFLTYFDEGFIGLFPTFVADFNALLQPGHEVLPDAEGRLSTTLRVFALIKMGIDSSSKIAEFLHASINTIYNYRSKVKNVAIGDRDHFEADVKNIGIKA